MQLNYKKAEKKLLREQVEYLKKQERVYLKINQEFRKEHQIEKITDKSTKNKVKHKISFTEAKSVFYDELALVIDDPEHSEDEERFIILGESEIYWWYVIVTESQKLL